MKKSIFSLFLALMSVALFAQCERLKGNNENMNNWKAEYADYFSIDTSSFSFIKADSVLIFYFSNSENETTEGMSCCYYLAEQYAQTELVELLKVLYSKLEKEDSINLATAQKSWQTYYENEWEFVRKAFVGYANVSKYGLGSEIRIENQSRKYQTIKERILMIKSLIDDI